MKFTEFRVKAQDVYKAVLEADAKRNECKQDTKTTIGRIYVQSYVDEQCKAVDEKFSAFVVEQADELKALASEVIAEHREKLEKALSVAPTAEQLNLLTALQLRDDISEEELNSIAGQLGTNFQAIKAMQSIAKKKGVNMHLPEKYDYETSKDNLDKAEKYLSERIYNLRNYRSKMQLDFYDRMFFGEGGYDNFYDAYTAELD